MNVFLYASSYILECVIPNLHYLLKFSIDKLYIYQEEYNLYKIVPKSEYNIIYESNLDMILENSDLTIIFNDGRISSKFVNAILELCIKQNKVHYEINLTQRPHLYTSFVSQYKLPHHKPVVLLCYSGEASQIEKMELSLNRLFSESNIRVKQIFSRQTYDIVNEIPDIAKIFSSEEHYENALEYNIIIVTISLEYLLGDSNEVYKDIIYLRPDFVLLCAQHNFTPYEDLKNLFKYKYNLGIDLTIRSNFITYIEKERDIGYRIKISLPHKDEVSKDIIYYNDEAEKIAYENIISKMTFPHDVKICNKREKLKS